MKLEEEIHLIETTTTMIPTTNQQQKVTKVRRTRQARNPQLSVARRNERERNRVKMVNNGFALLREHLPAEYLQQTLQADDQSDSGTPDLASNKSACSKTKKFSKVETLRAAIEHIKRLEQLMRSAEPDFESMQIGPNQQQDLLLSSQTTNFTISHQNAFDECDAPLSVCEPLSCASSSSLTSSAQSASSSNNNNNNNHHQQHLHQQIQIQMYQPFQQQQVGQFVKLEPAQSPSSIQQHLSPISEQANNLTHQWIEKHENSFVEHQQQWFSNCDSPQQQQQQQQQHLMQSQSAGSEQQQVWFAQQQQQQASGQFHYQQQQQQQQAYTNQYQHQIDMQHHQMFQAQHHQISLYSQ